MASFDLKQPLMHRRSIILRLRRARVSSITSRFSELRITFGRHCRCHKGKFSKSGGITSSTSPFSQKLLCPISRTFTLPRKKGTKFRLGGRLIALLATSYRTVEKSGAGGAVTRTRSHGPHIESNSEGGCLRLNVTS